MARKLLNARWRQQIVVIVFSLLEDEIMINRVSVAVLAFGLAGAALAGPGQQTPMSKVPSFEDLDKNSNGGISREEAKAFPKLDEIFSSVDADKNGELMVTEYRAATRKLKS